MRSTRRVWIERLARIGFAVKGLVYLVLGGLALQFGLGEGGRLTDTRGAVAAVLNTAYGRPLVGALAVGLGLYAGWRLLEAFADANGVGRSKKGLASRAMYALSGCVYGLLAIDAANLALAARDTRQTAAVPAPIVGSELAIWLAILVACGLIGYGLMQLRRATSGNLSDRLSLRRVERQMGPWPIRISRGGIAGRAVVLMLMGVALIRQAARSAGAAAETDTGDSLRLLAALPQGEWLLVAIAAGLMAYGVFNLVQARYRTITPP